MSVRRQRRTFTEDELSRERLADAAFELCRSDGVSGLTMRSLADRLDLPLPTIYRIVGDRDGLLDLVVDKIAAGLLAATPDDADLRTRCVIAYDWLLSVDGSASVLIEKLPLTPASLTYLGDTARLLGEHAPDPMTLAASWRVLWTYVVGCAAAAAARATPIAPTDGPPPEHATEILAALAAKAPRDLFLDGLDLLIAALGAPGPSQPAGRG
ncbi:MAG: hypothetical protein AAGF02_03665 [Actinomycetota bacterium]